MRFVESLFDPKTIAILFLFACCVSLLLYRSADRELLECQRWSARDFDALPRSMQEELRADWELERDLSEALAEEPAPRD
jgi:hypothetical protein